MRILITGASGEIGGALIESLRGAGREIRILTRGVPPADDRGCEWVRGDLRDPAGLPEVVAGVDAVLHLAAITHTNETALYHAANVEGTANLLRVAEAAGVGRFLYFSTRAIGVDGGGYSHSKMLAEERVRSASVPWVIFRPAEVFGGGGRDPILALVDTVRTRTLVPILGDGSYELSPVHVDDVVGAVVRSLDVPAAIGSAYTLAGAESMSYLRLVERIERFLGLPRPRIRVRVPVALARLVVSLNAALGRKGLVRDQIPRLLLPKSADNSRAARDLGYAPVALEKGLSRSLAAAGGG